MKKTEDYLHFEEKTAYEHLKEARKKGQIAFESVHGVEPSGSVMAAADAIREVSLYLAFTMLIGHVFSFGKEQLFFILITFSALLAMWKTARSAIFGWARLERVHRLILQEKWEIEHHRAQEKEELTELYKAKGFKDHQLEEIIEVLMADDNRLLQVMLEEELGLSLGSFEHPLKQCLGAFIGSISTSLLLALSFYLFPIWICFSLAFILMGISSYLAAKTLSNDKLKHIIWNIASLFVALATAYYLLESLMLTLGSR